MVKNSWCLGVLAPWWPKSSPRKQLAAKNAKRREGKKNKSEARLMKHEIACTNNIKIQIFKIPNKSKPSPFLVFVLFCFSPLFRSSALPLFLSSALPRFLASSLPFILLLVYSFGYLDFGHLELFRISNFGFRI
ncbi:MAG: hypothetical protein NT166_07990 [Candidatus Aminicenantes bacterium]|nr:hypothetical protein [Candidatus Aminicenantes bacterium]